MVDPQHEHYNIFVISFQYATHRGRNVEIEHPTTDHDVSIIVDTTAIECIIAVPWYELNLNQQYHHQQSYSQLLCSIMSLHLNWIMLITNVINTPLPVVQYPTRHYFTAFYSNKFCGRSGKRRSRKNRKKVDLYRLIDENVLQQVIHMKKSEFETIMSELKHQVGESLVDSSFSMSFENKVLLCLLFITRYPSDVDLSIQFNVPSSYVSGIHEMMPHFVSYFSKFIPNASRQTPSHSVLRHTIKYVMDDTAYKVRKRSIDQYLDYNGHYGVHCKKTQLLIDYDGYIIAFLTNIDGSVHDNLTAIYNDLFRSIVGCSRILASQPLTTYLGWKAKWSTKQTRTPWIWLFIIPDSNLSWWYIPSSWS